MRKKDNFSREKQRFSIVKVSGKTTSVLVGLTIFGGLLLDTPNVKADTNDNYKIEDVNSTGNSNINDKEVTLSSTNNTVSNTVTNVDESTGKETQNATNENQVTTVDSQVVNNENEVTSSNVNSTDSEVSDVVVNNETTSKELTPTTSHKVVRRSVNTLNTTSGQDRSSGTIDNPTVRSEDGESLIQIEGNKPAKPADAQLVTMYITIKAYGGDVHVNDLKFQINGVNATSDGTTRFKTGISNIDLTKNGEVYTVYIISKNATPEYALAHDDIEGLSADDKLIAYVKSKDTDITNMISNIVIEVASKPELSTRAEAGYVVQKGTKPLDINQVLSNADTIPDLNWDNYDTSAAGDFTPKIIATYPGASQSWGFEDKVKEEKSINIKVVDVQESQEEARNTVGTIEYKKASDDKKKAYDEALKKTLRLLTQATPASIEEYNQAQEALNNAKAALDGREQSIKFIDNLTNLNTAQKQELENKINAANTVDEIDKLQADATTLDKDMSDLTTVTSEQDTVKSDKNYTEADPDKKATYDTAIEDAQKVLKENSDSSQIKEALQKIADAKNALNGDEKLT
ncbi:hypothetical protein NOU10_08475, partial [Ligilactobacillus sp. MP3]|nr:hypothetical protein [Ligilactobacillus sp. MP3]